MVTYNAEEFHSAKIQIIIGEPGTGKTFFTAHDPLIEDALILDIEGRWSEMYGAHPEFAHLKDNVVICKVVDDDGLIDGIKTNQKLDDEVRKFAKNPRKLLVVDGVSDIRRNAVEEWVQGKLKLNKKRIQPATWGDWGEVNELTKDHVFRIINYAQLNDFRVIFTAWIVTKGDKEEVDCKEFLIAQMSETLFLKREITKFFVCRGKSPHGPTDWVDITNAWTPKEPIEGQ